MESFSGGCPMRTSRADKTHRVIRPSWRSALPAACLGAALAAALHYFLRQYGAEGIIFSAPLGQSVVEVSLPIWPLIFAIFLIRPLIRLIDSVYVIGSHHLYGISGRCSLRMRHVEVPYEDMRGVRIEQTIIERILNLGTIIVWTAAAESAAISMQRIADPEPVSDQIAHMIDLARMKAGAVPQPGQDLEIYHLRSAS